MLTVFRISRRQSLLAVVLAAMLLSACGDRMGAATAGDPPAGAVVAHLANKGEDPGAPGLRDGESRVIPLLVQWRCSLSRCSLVVRLRQSGLVRALLRR